LQKARDWLLVIVVNFMWATQVPVIRLMGDKIGPMAIAFVPMLISTILFMPFLWAENKKRKAVERRSWKDLRYFIIPGLIGIFLMQYLYTVGSTLTLASNAGIITSLDDTIDYAALFDIINTIMQKPVDLLETLVQNIAHAAHQRFPQLKEIAVSVEKLNPPIDKFTGSTAVKYSKKF